MKIILLQKLTGGVLKGLLKPRLNGLFTRMPVLAVLLLTAVVAACASGGGGGGGDSGGGGGGTLESSIFSHSSYTFIPLNVNVSSQAQVSGSSGPAPNSIPLNGIFLGSVLIREVEINKLVTAEINKLITAEDSKVDANDINIIDNYTIEYSFADDAAKDPSSILNRYLTIVPNIDSRGARIYASNPFAFQVSLADILADVPAVTVTVDITIAVSSLVKTEMSIVRTVPVRFPEVVDTFPAINDAVSFDFSKVSTKGGPVTPALMRAQSYIGNLSGSFVKGTVINGSTATSFTSLWMAANANLATDPRAGKIFPDGDNVFKISDLLNATETGIIQNIIVTLTPGEASEFNYTYPVPAPAPPLGTASANTPISVDALNGDSSTNNSLWKAISDANSTFTETNAAGIHVLNISIGWSFTYTYQRDFQPNDVTLLDGFELNRTVLFDEEQAATTTIPIKGVNNALNSYGFTPAPSTGTKEQRTIFFALLNSSAAVRNPSSQSLPLCSTQSIYLDNIDTQVKSATSFNYEDRDDEADLHFNCVLGASFDGAVYLPLVARINVTATPNADSNPISGFDGCGAAGDVRCYYASLTINITDRDEAPTITAPTLSIAEGVGPADADYPGNNFSPALGTLTENLATTGNLSVVPGNITIADTDEVANRTTNLPVNATETKVMSVSPTHGNGLFSIVKQDGGNNLFNLRVDASKLDYEKFTDNELKEGEGKAIYMVTISTQDTDGTVANKPVKPLQVPVEITDVIFAPVTAGSNIVRLGFTKATNIENRIVNGRKRIMLLSGASMIAHGRNTLGTVKAVDPETNSDNELFYAVSPNDSNLEQTSNNFAVVDGFGDGDVQNLVLNKLGLTTDFTIEVQVFYRPDNFDQDNPADISGALSNNNVIGLNTPISIDVEVDDTAYSDIDRANLLNPANSPVFNTRQFTGSVTEATAGDDVIGVSSSGTSFPPFNQNFIDISQEAANLDISPAFALVGAGGFGAFNAPQLQSLGVDPSHSSLFSIDKTTGAISLQGESTVEFPDFYSVVVRLANASDIDKTANPFSHDYAVVNILVNDINTAPVISDSNDFTSPDIQVVNGIGSYNETANKLTLNVTINENTPVGTVLARFTVTDDNDDMFAEHDFNFGAHINRDGDDYFQDAVKLTFTPASSVGKQKKSTATLTLVKPLNFEDFSQVTTQDAGSAVTIINDTITLSETRSISDKGRYEYNSLKQSQPKPISPAQNVLNASLAFNLVVLDVVEKPLIDTENSDTSGEIMENAPLGSPVTGININIVNINATDADALIYELGTEFAEVFNVSVTAASDENKRSLQLIVADVDKLENLGDGLVHTSNLTITNNTGGTGLQDKSNTITIQVRVIDVLQPINPIAVNMTNLQIRETDVDGDFSDGGSGGSYVIKENLFVLNPTDVSKDADDLVEIGGRDPAPLVAISYAITDVLLESSTPDDATDIDVTDGINSPLSSLLSLNPLSLNPSDENNNVGLAIDDTDYVEASLFGNITATLAFTGTSIGNTLPSSINSMDFTVEVIKANPKNVEYNTASDNAPVYTFTYSQSDYADEVTPDNVRADAILASAIISGGLTTEGAPPQINLTGDTYNTTLVRLGDDDDDDNDTYFIERDFTRLNKIQVTKNNQQQVDNGVIVIPFTSTENITTANIQILSEDASGKLEDSADNSDSFYNFNSYFDIKVNNTYHLASRGTSTGTDKVLLITQRQFSVINSNGEVDGSIKYNALDTIPLFQGETQATNRTYYIRVSQGDTPPDASNYALAQVHLNIAAAGLNIPPTYCTFAEDVGGTTDCGLLTLPQVFDSTTTYNITVGEVLAGQEVNTDKLGLSNFAFTQIVNGNPSDPRDVDPINDNDQLTLLSNATALNITINGIDENVFGEFYIDLVKSDDPAVKVRYTISITPVNDAPVFTAPPDNFANIPFNSTAGYSVGNVSATDIDGDTIEYSIIGGTDDTDLFQINPTSGEITLIAIAANTGTSPIPYTFNVIASDGNRGNVMTEITVSVLPVTPNQAPVFDPRTYNFNLSLSAANAPGVVVGKVSAMDEQGTPFDYSLEGGDNLFEPAAADNADGSRNIILRRAATLSDFAASSVIFQVVATHQFGELSSNAVVTVNLINDLELDDDSDGDGVMGFYDASPNDDTMNVTGNGESDNPYIISNIYQLQAIAGVDHAGTALGSSDFTNNSFLYGTDAADQLTKHYKLANDINASATADTTVWAKPAVTTYIGHGWTPIAGKSGQSFSGSFNGEGYAISNLNISLRAVNNTDSFGLFGTNNGNISAIGLENIEMRIQSVGDGLRFTTGNDNAPITIPNAGNGGLVGKNEQAGVIQYAYVSGLVNATAEKVGALVGSNLGEISYSYSTAAVEGRLDTGGLVGSNTAGGKILSSYATGSVNGAHGFRDASSSGGHNAVVGSLVGYVSGDANNIMNASYATGGAIADAYSTTTVPNRYIGHLLGQLVTGAMITSSYWYNNPDITVMGIGNVDDGTVTGHTGLSNAQLQGCGLGGVVIEGASPVPTTCTGLFPSSNWGSNTDTSADTFDITRGWVFNAGEYPSLNAVRSSDNKQLLPSAANQECQRNGMPLGCGEIEFVAVSGSGIRFTPAAGTNPASYSFANIPSGSPLGYSVGNVAATDPDGEAIAYNISGGDDDNALFQIDPTTGEITLQAQASDLGAYIFNVTASNSQGEDTTATISVTVVDSTPPVFTSTAYNLDLLLSVANVQGVVVGNVSAVDAEASLFDYSLERSDALFELADAKNADGSINIILSRAVTLSDFAAFPITFQVVATHQGGELSSEPANITVNLDNDLSLSDDVDADGIADFYDAFPDDGAKIVNGSGESDDPYIISNIYQLQAIAGVDHRGTALDSSIFTSYAFLYGADAADQLTKHYKLANDMDASATNEDIWAKPTVGSNNFIGHGWTPIAGGSGQSFSGSFAGDGYHIHNLNMDLQVANNKDTFGLFGVNRGNISAVGLTNINMQIAAINGSFINNTSLAGNGETESYTLGSGALVGTNSEGGSIKYAYSTGIVTVDGLYTGGLVGVNIGNVAYSYSTATVTGRRYTGGLVGTFGVPAVTSAEVASSYATGNVTTKFRGTENFGPGGLVGTIAQRSTPLSANIHASYAGNAKESVKFDNELRGLGVGGPLIGILSTGYNLNISYSFWTNSTLTTEETRVQFHTNLGGIYTLNALDLSGNNVEDEIFPIEPTQFMNCGLNECPFNPPSILFPSPHWDPNFDDPGIERGWLFQDGKYPALYANRTLNSIDTSLMPSLEAQDCHRIQVSDACGTYDAVE